jgi:hypothetical protein
LLAASTEPAPIETSPFKTKLWSLMSSLLTAPTFFYQLLSSLSHPYPSHSPPLTTSTILQANTTRFPTIPPPHTTLCLTTPPSLQEAPPRPKS